ncbi:MAG TPA: TolC family protein [Firmicutes bacterium]|nr:TolC family protein [Bacillota bacterium]
MGVITLQKRSWLIGLLVVVLMAVFAVTAAAEEREVRYVTLEEAEQIALENSVKLKLAKLAVEEAEFQYKQAEAAMIMKPSPVVLMQAQAGLDIARQQYLTALDELALEVRTDYFNALRMQNLLQIAQEGLESARRHEEVAKKKLAAGTATRLDVIKATRNVLNSQASVSQARHGLELAQMKFRQTLGLELDAAVLPKEIDLDVEPQEVDLEKDIEYALANRDEIKQLVLAIQVAEKNVEISDNDYTPVLTLEQAKLNLAKLKLQLEQARQGLALQIRQSYTDWKQAEERIPVLQKGVEEAVEMLRLSELSYEADMITSNDLQDAQLGVLSAKNDLINAIYDYNLAKARYFHAVARPLAGQQ